MPYKKIHFRLSAMAGIDEEEEIGEAAILKFKFATGSAIENRLEPYSFYKITP